MDAIGITPSAVILPHLPAVSAQGDSALLPVPGQAAHVPDLHNGQIPFDAGTAEQQRLAAVQQKAQDIANTHVLGDSEFTLFKDSGGQLITRFWNKETGKVTYVPQPELFKLNNTFEDTGATMLKIRA